MDEEKCYWVKSPFRDPKFTLNYHTPPTKQYTKFILLKDLGFGAEGRVWMVCSTAGHVGALKFRHDSTDNGIATDELQQEARNWYLLVWVSERCERYESC